MNYPMKTSSLALILVAAAALAPVVARADSDTDRKIEATAASTYNFHTVLQDQVKASSTDGVVTLTGTVQDRDQKGLAEDTVSSLPGVVSVNDQLTVASTNPEHSDGWIGFKIKTVLLTRAHVSATATNVTVKDGVVTLRGQVDSQAQKELTEAYAKDVDGVKSVKNRLKVVAPAGNAPQMTSTMDDASITAAVKYALLTHRATSAVATKVATSNGVVLVSGEAASDTERDLVSKLASDVRGVKSVTNEMTVKAAM
jgi:osmotically-inducible protein OsmY